MKSALIDLTLLRAEGKKTLSIKSIILYLQVVILTYEREQVLIDALVRLYGLPFLNKVLRIKISFT